jgi:hypothetical protein
VNPTVTADGAPTFEEPGPLPGAGQSLSHRRFEGSIRKVSRTGKGVGIENADGVQTMDHKDFRTKWLRIG